MKKYFNFRTSILLSLYTAYGILCGFLYIRQGVRAIAFMAILLMLVLLLAFLLIKIPFKSSFFASIAIALYEKRKFIVVFSITAVMSFILFFISLSSFSGRQSLYGQQAEVYGNVAECYKTKEEKYYFLLEKTTFVIQGKKYIPSGKVFVYVDDEYKAGVPKTGDSVSFTAKINKNEIYQNGYINTYAVRNSIYYTFFIDQQQLSVSAGNPAFFSAIRSAIKGQLKNFMREDNANISYALIVGDSLHMDRELKSIFSDSGIAHIFSVSGLHVGVLSAAIIFILKKLNIKSLYQITISAAVLLFYSALCGFAPSVLRAFLMTEIYLLSIFWGKKHDGLSSVSFAVFIILIISPLTLFDAGFLLSVSAVYSIFLLKGTFDKCFKFLPNGIKTSLSVSLSAQIGITPILAYYFNSFPLLSLPLNLLAIPLVSICYIAMLALLPLTALMPFLGFLYFFPQGLIEAVKLIVVAAEYSGISSVAIKPFNAIGTVLFYTALIVLSSFIFISKRKKAFLSIALSLAFLLNVFLSYLPLSYNKNSFSAVSINKMQLSIVTSKNDFHLVDYGVTNADSQLLNNFMYLNSIKKIDSYICISPSAASLDLIFLLKNRYNLKKVIIPYQAENSYHNQLMAAAGDVSVKYLLSKEKYIYKNLNIAAYYYNGDYYAANIQVDGFNALYLAKENADSLNYLQHSLFFNVNMLYMTDIQKDFLALYNPNVIITVKKPKLGFSNVYSTDVSGHLIFEINNDTIIRKYKY